MPVPKSYLTSAKNVPAILDAIRAGQAPEKFTQVHLKNLGFASSSDRLIIPVLRVLGFLNDDGSPTQRYYDFLDQTQSSKVLASALRETYDDLFRINKKAYDWSQTDLVNKLKTLTEGKYSDSVLAKMAMTFSTFAALADWESPEVPSRPEEVPPKAQTPKELVDRERGRVPHDSLQLTYTIVVQLPSSRDQSVYDAIFKSLKEHLLR